MKRISDEEFIGSQYPKDNIIAICIKDREFYFLGMMEDAETYNIRIPYNLNYPLSKANGI